MNTDRQSLIIPCHCTDLTHIARLDYYPSYEIKNGPNIGKFRPGDFMISMTMEPRHGFWKRFWIGLKYIFTARTGQWEYSDIVVDDEEFNKIRQFLEMVSETERLNQEEFDKTKN